MGVIKRIAVLTRLQCHGLMERAWWWLLGLWAVGLGLMLFGVRWDGKEAVVLGVPLASPPANGEASGQTVNSSVYFIPVAERGKEGSPC